MITYLKYLISFLLIFGLTVNECSTYSEISSSNYIQVSFINNRKELRNKHSGLFVYTGKDLSEIVFSIAFSTYQNVKKAYNTQTLIVLKLREALYQEINSIIAQRLFLNKINTTNNQYSSLYIA